MDFCIESGEAFDFPNRMSFRAPLCRNHAVPCSPTADLELIRDGSTWKEWRSVIVPFNLGTSESVMGENRVSSVAAIHAYWPEAQDDHGAQLLSSLRWLSRHTDNLSALTPDHHWQMKRNALEKHS